MITAETTALAAYDAGTPSTLLDSNKHKRNMEQHRWGAHGVYTPKCLVCQRDYRHALGCMNQAEAREWLVEVEHQVRTADFLGLQREGRQQAADVGRIRTALARGDQLIPVADRPSSDYASLVSA